MESKPLSSCPLCITTMSDHPRSLASENLTHTHNGNCSLPHLPTMSPIHSGYLAIVKMWRLCWQNNYVQRAEHTQFTYMYDSLLCYVTSPYDLSVFWSVNGKNGMRRMDKKYIYIYIACATLSDCALCKHCIVWLIRLAAVTRSDGNLLRTDPAQCHNIYDIYVYVHV